MPHVKTIRTVHQKIHREEDISKAPKYAIGDYMEIYFGHEEGHNFTVKDVRYNHDINTYEYLNGGFGGSWMTESQVSLVRKASANG